MSDARATSCPTCGGLFVRGEDACPTDAMALVPVKDSSGSNDPLIGAVVKDSFVVLERLGHGGMGVVYRALQHSLNRPVALKVLSSRFGNDPLAVERFRTEARAVSQLTSPHTVTVHDFGETGDGTLYLAMQLLEGETLRARIARGPLPARQALAIADDVCQSLAEAHERRIVHRDIKPDNIFVRDVEGAPFATVLDFGVARMADQRLTATDTTVGTVLYMAPEQARGGNVNERADLYSLGAVLFEMLTGAPPFRSDDRMAVLYQHVHEAPPRLSTASPWLRAPDGLESLLADLLAKRPDDRPASVSVVRGRIQALMVVLTEISSQPTAQSLAAGAGERHSTSGSMPTVGAATTVRRRWSARRALMAAGVIVAVMVGAWAFAKQPAVAPPPPPRPIAIAPVTVPAPSPDPPPARAPAPAERKAAAPREPRPVKPAAATGAHAVPSIDDQLREMLHSKQ